MNPVEKMKTQKQSKKEEVRNMKRIKICRKVPNARKSVLTNPILGQMNPLKMVFDSVIHTTTVKPRIK